MHNWRPDTWESNSGVSATPRALDDEELFIIEGSPTAKTGAQLRDDLEEREKWKNPLIAATLKAAQFALHAPVSVAQRECPQTAR